MNFFTDSTTEEFAERQARLDAGDIEGADAVEAAVRLRRAPKPAASGDLIRARRDIENLEAENAKLRRALDMRRRHDADDDRGRHDAADTRTRHDGEGG